MSEKMGRPMKFNNPDELQFAIDKYFNECKENKRTVITKTGDVIEIPDPRIPCIAGLAYALGVDRQTIYNYADKDDFFGTIKKARDYIFSLIEDGLTNDTINPTGKIFLAKNYGYTDKKEIESINTYSEQTINTIRDIINNAKSRND